MKDTASRKRLYDEAFALLARADALLDAMRAKYELHVAERKQRQKAA